MTSTSGPGTSSSSSSGRQRRMGPAPFASFEDLSDELESPDDKNVAGSVVRLPGIREDLTPTTPGHMDRSPSPSGFPYKGISLIGAVSNPLSVSITESANLSVKASIKPLGMPRIDISRASSSSHHDSHDSSPEREFIETHDPNTAKLGLGFKEDGALDLRSSTEELDFQDTGDRRRSKQRPPSPLAQEEVLAHGRKDSQCSDIVLLSISGRTSRLSSIGSQGSAQSGQSRLSNASHISVLSNQSGLSRCSSPHKMVLETSFCGAKPPGSEKSTAENKGTKVEQEDIEKIVLARKHDPTEAVIPEGISPVSPEPLTTKLRPEKPARKTVESTKNDITITVDKPQKDISNNQTASKMSSRIVSESGIEYIYIPLKGPLPADLPTVKSAPLPRIGKQKLREVKSANYQSKSTTASKTTKTHVEAKPRAKSATPSPVITKKEEPKYIRIKLKPDRCYSNDADNPPEEVQKPDTLELNKIQTLSSFVHEAPRKPSTPSSSPKFIKDIGIADSNRESTTPSPSVSRRSSFASLFKNKDLALSPESPTVSAHKRKNTITGILKEASDTVKIRSRSRSKSRERDSHKSSLSTAPSSTESIDSKTKNKSVLSLFKSGKKETIKSETDANSSQETLPSIEGIGKVEFKFNEPKKTHYENPLEAASIRIPLHSPEYYDNRSICQDWKTSSQDSQETVIEAPSKNADIVLEPISKHHDEKPQLIQANVVNTTSRQSSTSSDNIIFSTKLSDSEVFTTKLPKKLQKENGCKLKQSLVEKDVIKFVEKEVIKVEVNGIEPKHITKEIKPQVVKEHVKETVPAQINQKNSIVHIQNEISKENLIEKETKENKPQDVKESLIELKKLETDHFNKRISQLSEGVVSNVSSNADDDRNSSESEREVEEFAKNKKEKDLKLDLEISEPERKAIVLQQDSFEDELPYVPTTLPQERSAAIPIVPVKQRSTFEIKTYPIDRPRSTTPINPSCLEEYCEEVMGNFNVESVTKTIEKLKISLPRNESFDKAKPMKSPRKKESNQNWQEFAEKSLSRSTPTQANDTPPPLPPKRVQKAWINFEDIPEKRKAPKRIQTIPSRSYIEVPESVLQESVVYNYVNPEECKCECHEMNAKERERRNKEAQQVVQEDELPLLEDDNHDDEKGPDSSERIKLDVGVSDCRSVISDSSADLSTSIDPQENSVSDALLRTPFTSDLGISSNRSSIVSQDEPQSPGSPNAFPKVS